VKLCMFTPAESELERGWPGRIEGDVIVQLAAQTLQSFFTGGSAAREHARYALGDVLLRAPVLEPPAVRLFDGPGSFSFANPSAIRSPGAFIARPAGRLDVSIRLAAVIGLDGAIAGWTGLAEWRAPELEHPKDGDFALMLGPIVETELTDEFDWEAARALAELNTRLRPGDLLGGPALADYENVESGPFELTFDGVGTLTANVS
jgi:fumarylacetoacetate (FAA) hydrolase